MRARGRSLLSLAAGQGVPDAQVKLGYCYIKGIGVFKDETQAVVWYRKAAIQGNDRGEYALGFAYEHGLGVAADTAMANFFYNQAALQGNSDAKAALASTPPPAPTTATTAAPAGASASATAPANALTLVQPSTRFANASVQVLILFGIFVLLIMGPSIVLGPRSRNAKYA